MNSHITSQVELLRQDLIKLQDAELIRSEVGWRRESTSLVSQEEAFGVLRKEDVRPVLKLAGFHVDAPVYLGKL